MTNLFFLLCGVLSGSTGQTIVKVFPETGRIVGYEPGSKDIVLYDLEGNRICSYALEGLPAHCCEAGGYLFVNFVDEKEQIHLLRADSNFRAVRIEKNRSLFFPSQINGRTYGLDAIAFLKRKTDYPPIAQVFDLQGMKFGEDKMFKLPHELAKPSFPDIFWLFSVGESFVILYSTCSDILLLDRDCLWREKVESNKVAGTPIRIPLELPGGFKNKGSFNPGHAMRIEDARKQRLEWRNGQTQVFHAWKDDGDLMFGYGEANANQTHIARLDRRYIPQPVANFQGFLSAAQKKRIWLLIRKSDQVSINVANLPKL